MSMFLEIRAVLSLNTLRRIESNEELYTESLKAGWL